MRYRVGNVEEISAGSKKSYLVKNIPIVVVHSVKGEFYAIYARCPHQHADLADGTLGGVTVAEQPAQEFSYIREGEVIRCPWHGFSFDVTTGACMAEPQHLRVKTYPIIVEDQELFLDI